MLDFFSEIVEFFNLIVEFVSNIFEAFGTLLATLLGAVHIPQVIIGIVPSFLSASVAAVLALGVAKLIVGR